MPEQRTAKERQTPRSVDSRFTRNCKGLVGLFCSDNDSSDADMPRAILTRSDGRSPKMEYSAILVRIAQRSIPKTAGARQPIRSPPRARRHTYPVAYGSQESTTDANGMVD